MALLWNRVDHHSNAPGIHGVPAIRDEMGEVLEIRDGNAVVLGILHDGRMVVLWIHDATGVIPHLEIQVEGFLGVRVDWDR